MADGIYVNYRRPKSKKELKDAFKLNPGSVTLQSTSLFGGADGPLTELPVGNYAVVGPCPYTARKWYASIKVTAGKVVIS
jgi:hypothetical protein